MLGGQLLVLMPALYSRKLYRSLSCSSVRLNWGIWRRPGALVGCAEYLNISAPVATLLSKRMATLHELDTVYGVRDVYDMLEVITIDDYNNALANRE